MGEIVERSDGLNYGDVDFNAHSSGYSPQVYVGTSYTASACGWFGSPNQEVGCTTSH
jgi:hypothetical protein